MRKWKIKIQDWPAIRANHLYHLKVNAIKKINKKVSVDLEFLDTDINGRKITIFLPLPVRPGGITCDYFRACGMEIHVGSEISPHESIGCHIQASFMKYHDNNEFQIKNIRPVKKEK